jgi:enoyl-CoA hydratase/carnithine racemase
MPTHLTLTTISNNNNNITIISINKPPANGVELTLVTELEQTFTQLSTDTTIQGFIITSSVRNFFSGGIDTRALTKYDKSTRNSLLLAINRMLLALYSTPKPVIAIINGHALGAGIVLALACDYRIALRGEYKIGIIEALAGVAFPACPLEVTRAELSPENLRILALGSKTYRPDELPFGVIDQCFPVTTSQEQLVEIAIVEASRRASMPAYGAVKQQIRFQTIERMKKIVKEEQEPLMKSWL